MIGATSRVNVSCEHPLAGQGGDFDVCPRELGINTSKAAPRAAIEGATLTPRPKCSILLP